MKYPTRHFSDIRDIPGGSHQEMDYYRAWLERYAGLKKHIDEIDLKDLCGGDHEILNRHEDFKSLVDADRAAEVIGLTLYAKWMKPSTMIAARLKMGHPDIAKLFSVLKTLAVEKRDKMRGLYGEAVDAFCKTTLGHFGTDAPIDINSYRELEDAFENFGDAIGEPNAESAFEELESKYVAFVKDISAAESDGADIFYEECDHEEKKDLEEIIGNVECSNKDLEDLEEELRGYTNGYDVFIDWNADGRNFYDRIDPDGVAMSYTLMGLQWYHMWARSVGPCVLTDLLGMNKMLLESFIDRLSKMFPDTKQLCFKASKAIDLYTNFVHDADQFKLDRSAADYQRQLKFDSILEALRNVAYAIKEQEESFMSSNVAKAPQEGVEVSKYRKIMQDEHEQAQHCAKCPKHPLPSEKPDDASDFVINGLMSVCNHFRPGWIDEMNARIADLEKMLNKMCKDSPETKITFINYCALLYVLKLHEWGPFLRGEDSVRPNDIKYGKSYYLNVGEWVKCTIMRRLLDPLKAIIKNLPKLNAPGRSYPLQELREMFLHIDAMIGMMNSCEEAENSPEGAYLGHTVNAVYQLQQLVCPDEHRPGHVILECQGIAKAYAEFFKRMCNAAWALGFKVENRDRNEIELDDELNKVLPKTTRGPRGAVAKQVTPEDEQEQYAEIMQKFDTDCDTKKTNSEDQDILRQVIQDAIRNTPVTVGGLTKEGEKAIRKAAQRKPGKPASGTRVFTRPQIAKMFGVSEQAVYYWDHGQNAPAGYCEEMRLKGDIEGLIKCLDARNSLKDFVDVLNTKNIVRDGFNEEEVAAINGVLQDMLRRKRNGENILSTIEGL